MIEFQDIGIVLSVRPHGETGGIVTLLTQSHGRAAGYVYGAVSSRQRGTLEPGNIVTADWKAKGNSQLGTYKLELEKSMMAHVMQDPVKLTAMQSACALVNTTLPEHEKHANVYEGMRALLDAFTTDLWAMSYIFWEMGLLKELGFGLDLTRCVSTGDLDNLIYVSPKSGCAVSRAAGEIYKEKLLHLPPFLRGEATFAEDDIERGLALTGHFLLHRVFALSNKNLPEPRLRLAEKFTAMEIVAV